VPESAASGVAKFIGTFSGETAVGLPGIEALISGGAEGGENVGGWDDVPRR
jgi:hypothetical protein